MDVQTCINNTLALVRWIPKTNQFWILHCRAGSWPDTVFRYFHAEPRKHMHVDHVFFGLSDAPMPCSIRSNLTLLFRIFSGKKTRQSWQNNVGQANKVTLSTKGHSVFLRAWHTKMFVNFQTASFWKNTPVVHKTEANSLFHIRTGHTKKHIRFEQMCPKFFDAWVRNCISTHGLDKQSKHHKLTGSFGWKATSKIVSFVWRPAEKKWQLAATPNQTATPPAKNMCHPWPSSPEATGGVEFCTCTVGSRLEGGFAL